MDLDPNTPITLNLSLMKVNFILGALSKEPYERVAPLINEIQTIASNQIVEAQKMQANLQPATPPNSEPAQ